MRKLLPVLALCMVGTAQGAVSTEIRCFSSEGARPIRFELRLYQDAGIGWFGGAVRYAGSRGSLPLVLKSENVEERVPGRPYQFVTTWLEMLDGRVNGRYEMVTQGVQIYSMAYTNARTGKRMEFAWAADVETSGEDGCRW